MLTHTLTYHHNSAILFERIAHQPWAMLLDSGKMIDEKTGKPGSEYGRYDIMVSSPIATLVTSGEQTICNEKGKISTSKDNPFSLLKLFLQQYKAPKTKLPFAGGAMGYFAYDLAYRLEKIDYEQSLNDLPEMMVGIYDWAVVVDHREKRSLLISNGLSDETEKNWQEICRLFEQPFEPKENQFLVISKIKSNFSKNSYKTAFNKIKAFIKSGDFYQVNLAQRFSVQVQGDAWAAYKRLREISPAPFMAYMQLPAENNESIQVLSNSPERFIQVIDDHVETRPIKGTRPRSNDAVQDKINSNELLTSDKDKAENLMIVDLLRNDIGKNCTIGSVEVKKLFQLQSFANVHHLVSIITGKLKQGATAIDLLKGCFPGGSITGAPKIRAMQVIDSLEPDNRGIYCGAIGYIGFDGQLDTNIAIRTAVVHKGQLSFYAGGGIVGDSTCEKEYVETLDKAASMIKAIEHFMR
jgi:para-aminobenzoate synthetase component 1